MHYLHVEYMRSMQPDEKLCKGELRIVNLRMPEITKKNVVNLYNR